MQIFLKDIDKYIGQEVMLKGWSFNVRSSGKIAFIQFRDGSDIIQVVAEKSSLTEQQWADIKALTIESSLIIKGKVKQDDRSFSGYELELTDIEIVQISPEYPIGKKEHGPDFLLDQRHLWLRSQKQWAIQRVRNTIIYATYEFFAQNGFIKFDSPILTPNACEGTTELFEIDYFDWTKAYLSQSGQLYLEAGIMSLGRCFDFGPVFRAEKSKTRRHLTEFWMMDAEAAFVEHEENIQLQEALIIYIIEQVLSKNMKDLEILERDISALKKVKAPFVRLTHAQAVEQLRKLGSDIKDEADLGGDDETLLTKEYDRPVFVEKYPAKIKAFYMKRDPQDESLALCSDLLAPEGYGEIIGGSQREDDYDNLLQKIKEHGLEPATFDWYLDLRRYGSVPHSGFGYGLERLTTWLCGLAHVRETIPFPRLINRIKP